MREEREARVREGRGAGCLSLAILQWLSQFCPSQSLAAQRFDRGSPLNHAVIGYRIRSGRTCRNKHHLPGCHRSVNMLMSRPLT